MLTEEQRVDYDPFAFVVFTGLFNPIGCPVGVTE